MRYFVIAADGNKYGPADLATLNAWITEGRLLPTQMLEDETTGARQSASVVPGLNFGPGPQMSGMPAQASAPGYAPTAAQPGYGEQPGGFQNPPGYYPRGATGFVGDNGQSDLTQAYVFGALGILCCPLIFSLLGLSAANRAEAKGNPGAKGAKILNYVGLGLLVVGVIFQIIAVIFGLRG